MKSLSRVTVIKFNSAERHGSYIEKPCREQAHYSKRIQQEPDFLNQELILAIGRMLLGISSSAFTFLRSM